MFGVHLSPSDGGWADETLDLAVSLGASAVKLPAPDKSVLQRCATRFPIVIARRMPDHVHDSNAADFAEATRHYMTWWREAGRTDALYVQVGNEHNHEGEWGGKLAVDSALYSAQWWVLCAKAVRDAGGTPVTTPPAQYNPHYPGGTLAWLYNWYHSITLMRGGLDVLAQSILGVHNYSHTHDGFDLNHPEGFQMPVTVHDIVLQQTGLDLAVMALEGGTWPAWVNNDERRYAIMTSVQIAVACGKPALDPDTLRPVKAFPPYVRVPYMHWTAGLQPDKPLNRWDSHDLRRHPQAIEAVRMLGIKQGKLVVEPIQPKKEIPMFSIEEFRRLQPCENHGMNILFVEFQDEQGKPLDGEVAVMSFWDRTVRVVSGSKAPGKAEIDLYPNMGDCVVYPEKQPDLKSPPFTTALWLHESCVSGTDGNHFGHHSFKVVFKRGVAAPPPVDTNGFKLGFADYVKANPQLGIVDISEGFGAYGLHPTGDVVQAVRTKDGKARLLIWNKASGEIGLFPPVK